MTTPAPAFSQHQHDLLQTAMAVLAAGVSLVPVSAATKQPVAALLPTDRDGKSSWKAFQSRLPMPDELLFWIQSHAQLAVVAGLISGGLMVLDFDEPRFFDTFKQQVDITPFPVQRTGGGGYQLMFRCPQPKHNLKLAWVADSTEPEGRRIAIETRGEGGYAVIAPSLHPSGNHYTMLQGSFGAIPLISQAEAEQLLEAASQLDEMPYTAKQLHAMNQAMQQPQQQSLGTASNVIEQFNQATSIEAELHNAGYAQTYNNRWQRPGGSSGSVIIKQSKSFHHSSNDPLSDGFWHDPFDIWCYYTHRGDAKQAVKEAAILLCIPMASPQPTPTPSQPSAAPPPAAPAPAPTQAFHPILTDASLTDLGNAECLAVMKGDELRYCRSNKSWFWWNGQRWQKDADAQAKMLFFEVMDFRMYASAHIPDPDKASKLFNFAYRTRNKRNYAPALDTATVLPAFNTMINDYDRDIWQLGLANGTLDLQTQTLLPADPTHMITMQANVVYDASADCSRWKQFLVEVFNNDAELIRYLQRVIGYALTGDRREQKMFILYGDGNNGKSVFIETIRYLFGDYGATSPSSTFDGNRREGDPTNDLAMLYRKRFTAISETNVDNRLNEGLVKRCTGDEEVSCRFLHKEFFSYIPTWIVFMGTNHLPVIRNIDNGIWRRLVPIPFMQDFTGREDRTLSRTLKQEIAGILNWALEGLTDWLANGLGTAKAIEDSKRVYRTNSDVVGQFLEEMYVDDTSCQPTPSVDIYKDFQGWSFERGEKAMTSTSFGRIMSGKGYESTRRLIDNRKQTVYLGIRKRTQYDP